MDQQLTAAGPAGRRGQEGGFTIVEVLIALVVLLVGLAGILSMQMTAISATGFERHATEASTLAQDKMEALRTVSSAELQSGSDQVDPRGVPDPSGLFTREWTVANGASDFTITVKITWLEGGGEPYTITMSTLRAQ